MGAFVSSSRVSDARVLGSHASAEQREETALPGICSFPAVWISTGALSSGLLRESSCTPPPAKWADCFSSWSAGGQVVPGKHLLPGKWLRLPSPGLLVTKANLLLAEEPPCHPGLPPSGLVQRPIFSAALAADSPAFRASAHTTLTKELTFYL